MTSYTTVEQIDQIASLNDPILHNLQITQSYSELSAVFTKPMGAYANWCTFATWASKQAGQTIRHEDLQRAIESLLRNVPEVETALSLIITLAKQTGAQESFDQLYKTSIGIIINSTVNRASDAVGRGNKKVFEEIAAEFALFMSGCFNDAAYLQSGIDEFCKHFKQGQPPDGQDFLQSAFRCYYKALFENDVRKKTELNLLANLQVGFHEQNRLQPEIAAALNASAIDIQQIKSEWLSHLFSRSNFLTKIRLFFQRLFGKTVLDKAIESLLERMQHHIRIILTAHLMTITLPPDNLLHLSKDLAIPFPVDLQQLANADLLALLSQIDPTKDSMLESGATDWADLRERMHFIADMFRCYHESKDLFDTAFSAEQIEAIKNGNIPAGRL
ncbi:MAG TPA: hypothetical protein VFW07_21010 [Parafilimonas sp.]|nr:hypothetical protein [Parafilimonas sp.]